MFRRLAVPIVVVVAIAVALVSLSYPSIVVSNTNSLAIRNFGTYTSQYVSGYFQMSASTGLAGYLTSTAWYPGDPICDPASNACTPYPTPTATMVFPQSATYNYQVTVTSEATSTYTSEFTVLSTETSYQNVAPYSAAGLTQTQFGIVTILVVAVVMLGILSVYVKIGSPTKLEGAKVRLAPTGAVKFCPKCGRQSSRTDNFCSKCGAQL